MSRTVDERVVEMRFDNANFEKNVRTSMSTLDKLKKSLNLSGASKGLDELGKAANNVSFDGMRSGIETVTAKFSALQVMGITALMNITNSAINAGKRIADAITIAPIRDGFAEYETQMNAVQTILANTQKEGTNVKQVNAALDELNHYADKTIYNFTEMTRNIGTFTAAGVKLDTSVSAIQGIANLAAVSGSTSQQASTAMYQLSQALATGTVKLMDWNSVVNAGMGGQVFQDALIRTAEHLQTGAKAAIAAKGSFRESLQTGWLTTEVLTQTLDQFATAADSQQEYEAAIKKFLDQGYTQEEAKQMADMARTAGDAATKVKTFSQLIDTLKEALGSGWTETWRTVIGDFEEAKTLWTSVNDVLSTAINNASDARNAIVKEWAELGGRTALLESFKNVFESIVSIAKPISEAFREIFPPVTAKQLLGFTEGLKELTSKMKISDTTAKKLKNTFGGLFSVVSVFGKILASVGRTFGQLITSDGVHSIIQLILSVTSAIGSFFTSLNKGFDTKGFSGVLSSIASGFSELLLIVTGVSNKIGKLIPKAGHGIITALSTVWDAFKTVFNWIKSNITMGDVFKAIIGGGFSVGIMKVVSVISLVKEKIEDFLGKGEKVTSHFSEILDSVHESLSSFTVGIKASTLITIAGAIGILALSLHKIAELSTGDIARSLAAMGTMFVMLNAVFKSINATLFMYDTKGLIKAGTSILLIAVALKTLATAMTKMAGLSWNEIIKGLTGVGAGLAGLCLAFKSINNTLFMYDTKGLIKAGAAILLVSAALKVISDVMVKMAGLSWNDLSKGLVGVGVGLAELCIAFNAINSSLFMYNAKGLVKAGVAIIILASAMKVMTSAMTKMAGLSWSEIARGLTGMGGALTELVATLAVLSKIGGKSSILSSVSILIIVQSLSKMADGLQKFGKMSWSSIGRGLSGMGGALGELSIAVGTLGKIAGFKSIIGSGAILIVVQGLGKLTSAFKQFASVSWDGVARGLSGMGGALAEVATVSGALGKIAGFKGIIGSGSILIVIQGLGDLAKSFTQFSGLSWDEIKRGLSGMGGALAELAIISGTLGKLTGLSGILGSASLLAGVQSLSKLADAFSIFSGLSWDAVKNGLVGMGGALAEVATVSGALGALGGLGAAIGAGSLYVAIQGLNDLADAFKKFGDMSWGEIARGLAAMGTALHEVAGGSLINTLSGLGAVSISKIAAPLGDLADSVKKWNGVSVPKGLNKQLSSLAKGIRSFTFDGLGASALSTAAPGIGELADSLKKWTGVIIPHGLESGLKSIATGVKEFTWAFAGGFSLNAVVKPLAKLADSIKKWDGIIIPYGIDKGLTSIANGVKAFSLAFAGGWSLSTVVKPLGKLAESISKWNGISVPYGIEKGLTSIANGVKAFGLAFAGGWSLNAVTKPIGDLAGSIKKWTGVNIPKGIGKQLSSLSKGVRSFTFDGFGANNLSETAKGLTELSDGLRKWSTVSVPENTTENLKALAEGVRSFTLDGMGANALNTAATGLGELAGAIEKWSGVIIPSNLETSLESISNGVKEFTLAFAGGWSLNTVTGPLGDLADSISKWSGVIIPDGLENGLARIASGIKEFSLAFAGGWSLSTVTGPLGDLAMSIKKWSDVKVPSDIETGLTAIANGVKKFTLAFAGGWSLDTTVTPLGQLADSIKKWKDVKVPEDLESGLTSIANGVKAFSLAFAGGWSLDTAVVPLGELADSIRNWSDVTVPSGLESGLTSIANGVKAFSLAFAGGWSLDTVTGPLGDLSTSIKKWSDVTIPDGLENGLISIANGVKAFALAFVAGWSLDTVVDPLGQLAGSIKKWSDVTIPSGLESGLTSIANGVKAFGLSLLGGWSLDTVVEPIGQLAGSIKKWNDVTIPDGLESGMSSIANGVKAFASAFVGGWTLDASVGPIGQLAGSIKKWNSVSIPEGLEKGLKSIANGVKAFGTAFVGGWSLSAVTGPVGDLAGAISKWNSVSIPENLGSNLTGLATGVKSFSGIEDISSTVSSIGKIASSTTTLASIDFTTIGGGLSTFATSITDLVASANSLAGIGDTIANNLIIPIQNAGSTLTVAVNSLIHIALANLSNSASQFATAGQQIVTSFSNAFIYAAPIIASATNGMLLTMNSAIVTGSSQIVTTVNSMMMNISTNISSRQASFNSIASQLMNSFKNGVSSSSSGIISTVRTIVTKMKSTITSKKGQFENAGSSLMTSLGNGIRNNASSASNAVTSALSSCSGAIRSYWGSFYSAGRYLGDGLTAGIRAKESEAYWAGYRLGEEAVKGEKDGQQSKSPSKATKKAGRWLGEGLIIGMDQMGKAVYRSGESMGINAVDSITGALSLIDDASISNNALTPTIQPVFDMSELQNGSRTLSIGADLSASLLSKPVTTLQDMISSAQQSINASNNEVIQAINDLRADLNAFYSDDEKEIALYMNSKKVASTLAKDMNRQLAVLQKRGAY